MSFVFDWNFRNLFYVFLMLQLFGATVDLFDRYRLVCIILSVCVCIIVRFE